MKTRLATFFLAGSLLQNARTRQSPRRHPRIRLLAYLLILQPTAVDSGSQGPSQTPSAGLISTSDLSKEIAQFCTPPGGFQGNPNTYSFHDGSAT